MNHSKKHKQKNEYNNKIAITKQPNNKTKKYKTIQTLIVIK
jgi:hypothetical protein